MNEDLEIEIYRINHDPQEQKELFNCEICGCEIYKGEEYYEYYGDILCEKCFDKKQELEKNECKKVVD